MTEWLLSGHNTQETTGTARPVTLSMTESGLDAQISWFLGRLAGDTSDFDPTLKPTQVVQGQLYLNIDYYTRNMARVMPFDSESVGAPAHLIQETEKVPPARMMRLPWRFRETYRWAADFNRHTMPDVECRLREIYWQLREGSGDMLPLIRELFEPPFYPQTRDVDRAHIVITLTITALDGVLRQRVPELLNLFAGQATTTSLIGQRIWELSQAVEECGPQVQELLEQGVVELEAYQGVPEAAPLMAGVRSFIREYGHRGFRHEADLETERLADRPEHLILAIASQMKESEPPEVRADAARRSAEAALQRMNPVNRLFWRRILEWGQQMITWREVSKSNIALRQAAYGLAARHMARNFYPNEPDDEMMFYTLDELMEFVRTEGQAQVEQETLDRRRAQFELHQTQPAPPELVWYNPETCHWRPALSEEAEEVVSTITQLEGIAASAGSGPAEGVAVVTNDPLDAARRLMELEGPVILITRLTDPAWSSLFRRLNGVVTELGGVISHAAIVARENGLPAVVGVPDATRRLRNGQQLRINGATGIVEVVEQANDL